ncbi:MAG: hypothetical protein WCV62_01345 [Candidatus Peribacteraceae bacterium]
MKFLTTTKGKLAALFVAYIPFFCALFFLFFEGKTYESPIGGCCIPMEGVVAAGYALFSVWILAPLLLIYSVYLIYILFSKKGRR